MKILCVNGVKIGDKGTLHIELSDVIATNMDAIYEGEYYHSLSEHFVNGRLYYKLYGKPELNRYDVRRFVPCSEVDERELVHELVDIDTGD